MKLLADFIMRGRLQAILMTATIAMISLRFPPFSIFSLAAIALVTLRQGAQQGIIILACAGIVAGVLAIFLTVNPVIVPLNVVLIWLPVWLISIVLREGRHLSLAVEIAVLLGVVAIGVYFLYIPEPADLWKQMLPQMMPPSTPIEKMKEIVAVLPKFMTGIAAAASIFGILLGVLLGRWWQALLYNPGGFKKEFLEFSAQPKIAYVGFAIIIIALANFGKVSEIAWNIAILALVIYILAGTAVLHTVFSKMSIGNMAIPMFYITLVLIPHTAFPIVSLVGLADTWLNIRKINLKQT